MNDRRFSIIVSGIPFATGMICRPSTRMPQAPMIRTSTFTPASSATMCSGGASDRKIGPKFAVSIQVLRVTTRYLTA